jgi:phospholipid-binding lipoprotein MlaA
VRDGLGAIVNFSLDPFNWIEFDGDDEFLAFRTVMSALATREAVLEAVDNVRQSSIDPYVTIRSTYGLLRESSIRNGLRDVQDLPDFAPMPNDWTTPEAPPAGSEAPTGSEMPQSAPPMADTETEGLTP